MLIAIISDIHDNLANLAKGLDWCKEKEVAKIICLGDIVSLSTVSYFAQNFPGEIFLVGGNADLYRETDLKIFPNINYAGLIGYVEVGGLSFGFCHEPQRLKKLIADAPAKLDFIFYGHTHRPDLKKYDNVLSANPGSLGALPPAATFAVLDTATKNLELKILAKL
jgi:putative phosphoesterase